MEHYTITIEDVHKEAIRAFGQAWPVNCFLGHIMECDVGKRVYLRGGQLQVENQEQYMARLACCPTEQAAMHNQNAASIKGATSCTCLRHVSGCGRLAVVRLFRVVMYAHETPIYDTPPIGFCEPCSSVALESGLYCVGDDLMEPHHGPIHEGGQS